MIDIWQNRGLVGRGDLVDTLPLGVGDVKRLDRTDGIGRIGRVGGEHLLRHGVLQGRGEYPGLLHEADLFALVPVQTGGEGGHGVQVHFNPARLDGSGKAEEVIHLGHVAVGADGGHQALSCLALQACDMGERRVLGEVTEAAGMEHVAQQGFAIHRGDLCRVTGFEFRFGVCNSRLQLAQARGGDFVFDGGVVEFNI